MKQCVVTGGAGFIGSNLTRRLAEQGLEVTVIDNLSTGRLENLAGLTERIRFIEGDIRDSALLREAFHGAEVVFHQAAIASVQASVDDPATCNAVNLTGTLNVLLAAKEAGVRRVVFASSSAVYGDSEALPLDEKTPANPLSPYAITKRAGELYCRAFASLYGLDTACLRYFNVFGPRQNPDSEYSAVIPKFVLAALSGRSPVVYGDGEQSRDFIFVEDVIEANLLAAAHPGRLGGRAINVGTGSQTSLNQLLQALGETLGRKVVPRHQLARVGDIRHSVAGIVRARELLGFKPQYTFADALKITVRWFAQNQAGSAVNEAAATGTDSPVGGTGQGVVFTSV